MSAIDQNSREQRARRDSHPDAIIVYNRKSIEDMQREGGCGYWPVGRDPNSLHARGIRCVLCIRNRPGEPGHGRAYLVATLCDRHELRPQRTNENGRPVVRRQLLKLDRWAPITSENEWLVRENFEYGGLVSFGVDVGSLDFRAFVTADLENQGAAGDDLGVQVPGADAGPRGDGTRSEAVWSAKHSPLCDRIVRELKDFLPVNGHPWRPDILCEAPDGSLVLIEVKPTCDTHNIITAIGQLTAYSDGLFNVTKIIAAPGLHSLKKNPLLCHLAEALEAQKIKLLDLGRDPREQLRRLVPTYPGGSAAATHEERARR